MKMKLWEMQAQAQHREDEKRRIALAITNGILGFIFGAVRVSNALRVEKHRAYKAFLAAKCERDKAVVAVVRARRNHRAVRPLVSTLVDVNAKLRKVVMA